MSSVLQKKIAVISSSLAGGGAQKVAINLCNSFAEIGHRVDLVTFFEGPVGADPLHPHVRVIPLHLKRLRNSFWKLRHYLKAEKPEVILSTLRSTNFITGFAAIGLKGSHIFFREANTLHEIMRRPWPLRWLFLKLMKLSYRRVSGVIANSSDTKKDIVSNKIVAEEKVRVIHNPVLPAQYQSLLDQETTEEWFNDPDKEVVLSVGKLHVQKNFPLLIKAFQRVNSLNDKARLVIIGEGEERLNILNLIQSFNLQDVVKLFGFQGNIFPYMKRAKVFVLSSEWEGFGNVIVESLAAGTSVICTNCAGGPKEILDHGRFGDLVELYDADALANKIVYRLEHPMNSSQLKERAMDFSGPAISKKYSEFMKVAAGGN